MMKEFFAAIKAYVEAIKHISKHGMWGYVMVPAMLSILLGLGIFGLAWNLSDNVGGILERLWIWEWGSSVVSSIAKLLGGILVFLLGLLVFKQLVMVISSPIMSILSEKVEDQLMGRQSGAGFTIQQIANDAVRGLRIALRNIFRELGGTVLLLLLGLIPILSPFTTVLIFLLQAYYAGFGNLDFALERHYRFHESVKFVQTNRMLALGNGAVFMLMLYTIIGFPFALPLGTVAATIAATKRIGGES